MKTTNPTTRRLFLTTPLLVLSAASSASAIIIAQEDFSGPAFPFSQEGAEAAVIENNAGVGTYVSDVPDNPDAGAAYSWDGQSLRADQSWIFSVEASLGTAFVDQMLTEEAGENAAIGIMVGRAALSFSNVMFLSLGAENSGQGNRTYIVMEKVVADTASDASEGAAELFYQANLILSYDATTGILAAKTLDGTGVLGSVDVVNDWGMSASDTFAFGIQGNSGNIAAADGDDMWLDNMSLETVPEPSSTALLGLGGLALMLRRRR